MANPKTDEEWDKINFKNSLGPQIGGLMHDAVAIVVADMKAHKELALTDTVKTGIKFWLDALYEIAESKKAQLTEESKEIKISVGPLNIDKAVKQGDKWKKETLKEEAERRKAETAYEEEKPNKNLEEANKKIDQEVMEGREREAQDKLIQQ